MRGITESITAPSHNQMPDFFRVSVLTFNYTVPISPELTAAFEQMTQQWSKNILGDLRKSLGPALDPEVLRGFQRCLLPPNLRVHVDDESVSQVYDFLQEEVIPLYLVPRGSISVRLLRAPDRRSRPRVLSDRYEAMIEDCEAVLAGVEHPAVRDEVLFARDGLAIDRQREDCENLARFRRWDVVETYVYQSKSATDRTAIRPDYDRVVADYLLGRFDAIICYDLDRLTRQPRQLEDWIDVAELRGLAVVTANGDADLSTDGGCMYARIKTAVARAEMDRKSARQFAVQRQRAVQGRAPKGMRPLGYAVDGEAIPHEAEAVRAIYDLFTRIERPE